MAKNHLGEDIIEYPKFLHNTPEGSVLLKDDKEEKAFMEKYPDFNEEPVEVKKDKGWKK